MADYYPLLAKAVAALPESTQQARRDVYERAREALFGQLRKLDPPVPAEVIEREAQALEVAVAQIETEIAARSPPEEPAPLIEAEAPPAPGAERDFDLAPRPLAGRRFTPFKVRPPRSREMPGLEAPVISQPEELPAEEDLSGASGFLQASPAGDTGERLETGEAAMAWAEAQRPFAPQPQPLALGNSRRLIAAGGVLAAAVVAIAIAAYRMRDRPEDLMPAQPAQEAPKGEAAGGAKITGRAGEEAAPAQAPAAEGAAPAAPAQEANAAGQASSAPPVLPVARRAALLVEAPEEPSKVKTLTGTVVWRIENVSGGPEEPLRNAIEAEVTIPDEKLQALIVVQKNFDATLPASHTVRLSFTLAAESPLGGIKQISALQMRREDTPTGEALKGVTVPITENSFLIGLAKGDAEAHNLDLLRAREWLDIPILLANGRIAKLTFEKGPFGQRAIDEAMASWQGQ